MILYKTTKHFFIHSLIIIFLLLISCGQDADESAKAYYNFRGDDFGKLLNVEQAQMIKYQNQSGEILIYQVENITDDYKKQYISGGGAILTVSVPKKYHYFYDMKEISFNVSPRKYKIEYVFKRIPVDKDEAASNSHKEFESSFRGQFFFINWNGLETWNGMSGVSENGIEIDYEAVSTAMNVNGTVYEQVYVIASGNPNPLINGVIERTVNVIYYDKHHGLIGFDETNGKCWRIIN